MNMENTENSHLFRGNPEDHARKAEAMRAPPFEIMTGQVPESVVHQLMEDQVLMKELASAQWPTDEASCELVGIRRGLGAEQIAAVSKHQRDIAMQNKGSGSIH